MPENTVLFDRKDPDNYEITKGLDLEDDRSLFAAVRHAELTGKKTKIDDLLSYCTKKISHFNRFKLDPGVLERFQVNWNRSQAATAARRSSGAPAQARTIGSAAVSEKNLERFQATWNCSSATFAVARSNSWLYASHWLPWRGFGRYVVSPQRDTASRSGGH